MRCWPVRELAPGDPLIDVNGRQGKAVQVGPCLDAVPLCFEAHAVLCLSLNRYPHVSHGGFDSGFHGSYPLFCYRSERSNNGEPASMLRVIFPKASGNPEVIADWLAQPEADAAIVNKGAKGESLYKIAELMGNSPEICRRHYAALMPEKMHDVVEFSPGSSWKADKTEVMLKQILEKLHQKEPVSAGPRLRLIRTAVDEVASWTPVRAFMLAVVVRLGEKEKSPRFFAGSHTCRLSVLTAG